MIENLKEIKSSPITGNETLKELMDKSFTAFFSSYTKNIIEKRAGQNLLNKKFTFGLSEVLIDLDLNLSQYNKYIKYPYEKILEASYLLKKWIEEDYTIFLTFAGALTSADFGTSCLIPLIQRGIIDCITTTGANIYHEIQRVAGGKFYEYDLKKQNEDVAKNDIVLANEKFARIYNIIFPEKDLFITDDFIVDKIFNSVCLKEKSYSFTDFMEIVSDILFFENEFKSWVSFATAFHIPVFCGAPQDSSLFLPMAFYELIGKKVFNFDIKKDVNEMAALQYFAQKNGKTAVIILGGGVPKNFTLQGEPYLKDFCGLDIRGFDGDFQISMADVRDGGLSSCPASESHTWGKVSRDAVLSSLYISGEVLSIFPLLVYEICRMNLGKRHKRLFIKKYNALKELKKAVKYRKGPMTVHEYDKLTD